MELEICCGDINSVVEALKGGAKRIELCSGLSEGGLTPSLALIKRSVLSGIPQVNVLIRPRSGDFVYSEEEVKTMADDIAIAIENGADGIVIGALTPEGDVDMDVMNIFMDRIRNLEKTNDKKIYVTFHRAFDQCINPEKSLQDIIRLGCDCLLTSGLSSKAEDGIPVLKALVNQSKGKLTIMAGSGVTSENAPKIIQASGVDAIHSTARKKKKQSTLFLREEVSMGKENKEEFSRYETSADEVKKLLNCIER